MHQSGLTMLELMVSLALGLLLLTGVGTIYVGSNQTYRVQEQNARLQESGRYALELIGRNLRQAGYWNLPANKTSLFAGFSGTPINGNNGIGAAADSLTIQYDGTIGDRDCEGTNVTAGLIPILLQSTIQLDAANFELECDGNADAAVDPQPLVNNVEDLQFLYGIDTDADQSTNQYVSAPGNWNQVVSVRACILIRSEEVGITSAAQRFLNCAGALGVAAGGAAFTNATDRRIRRTFVATFNLRNRVNN